MAMPHHRRGTAMTKKCGTGKSDEGQIRFELTDLVLGAVNEAARVLPTRHMQRARYDFSNACP